MKSERLKKLEQELHDLQHWLNLGLVPKKDIEKHKIEIEGLNKRIEEEKERLRQIKESGDVEEYSAPKRTPGQRPVYQEPHTMPGVEMESEGMTESGLDLETEAFDGEGTSSGEGDEATVMEEEEEEDYFSDKNRWRRGISLDPDSDQW